MNVLEKGGKGRRHNGLNDYRLLCGGTSIDGQGLINEDVGYARRAYRLRASAHLPRG